MPRVAVLTAAVLGRRYPINGRIGSFFQVWMIVGMKVDMQTHGTTWMRLVGRLEAQECAWREYYSERTGMGNANGRGEQHTL